MGTVTIGRDIDPFQYVWNDRTHEITVASLAALPPEFRKETYFTYMLALLKLRGVNQAFKLARPESNDESIRVAEHGFCSMPLRGMRVSPIKLDLLKEIVSLVNKAVSSPEAYIKWGDGSFVLWQKQHYLLTIKLSEFGWKVISNGCQSCNSILFVPHEGNSEFRNNPTAPHGSLFLNTEYREHGAGFINGITEGQWQKISYAFFLLGYGNSMKPFGSYTNLKAEENLVDATPPNIESPPVVRRKLSKDLERAKGPPPTQEKGYPLRVCPAYLQVKREVRWIPAPTDPRSPYYRGR